MKVSDYIADFVAKQGVEHVFGVTGGADLHMVHSFALHPGIQFVPMAHEQAAAMAADAYARLTGLGCAVATSGPGATNLLTGVCCSWFDSIPVLYLTGQVATGRQGCQEDVYSARQGGFQEAPVVSIFGPVTKSSRLVNSPECLRSALVGAVHRALSGRPGPVLLDIADDVARSGIDEGEPPGRFSALRSATPPDAVAEVARGLSKAQRPVIIAGRGLWLSGAKEAFEALVNSLGVPVVCTWGAPDILSEDNKWHLGRFGVTGSIRANYAIQNADLIVAFGARLDERQTGSPVSRFAPRAAIHVVDTDPRQLEYLCTTGLPVRTHEADARLFVEELSVHKGLPRYNRPQWWGELYAVGADRPERKYAGRFPPYLALEILSNEAPGNAIICTDTGMGLAWTMQTWKFKGTQRFIHATNNTPMGYGLPAAIGAAFAHPDRPVICITGDGGLAMNMQELATVRKHDLNIKVFLINNGGYGMIQQTEDQWFKARHFGSSVSTGVPLPEDWCMLVDAFGLDSAGCNTDAGLEAVLGMAFQEGPFLVEMNISLNERMVPFIPAGGSLGG